MRRCRANLAVSATPGGGGYLTRQPINARWVHDDLHALPSRWLAGAFNPTDKISTRRLLGRLMPKNKLSGVASLRPHPENPRSMTDRAARGLKASLTQFGDIAGIVWNARSGTLVCGHQRVDALRDEYGDKLEIVDDAIVTPTGKTFRIRTVDVDEATHVAMMLSANHTTIQGDWEGDLADLVKQASEGVDLATFEAIGLDELAEIANGGGGGDGPLDDDEVPEPPKRR